jgi:hypothetical protein
LHGSLVENLEAAVDSAQRLRGRRIYPQTLQFWSDLLEVARRAMDVMIDSDTPRIVVLTDQLQFEIQKYREN